MWNRIVPSTRLRKDRIPVCLTEQRISSFCCADSEDSSIPEGRTAVSFTNNHGAGPGGVLGGNSKGFRGGLGDQREPPMASKPQPRGGSNSNYSCCSLSALRLQCFEYVERTHDERMRFSSRSAKTRHETAFMIGTTTGMSPSTMNLQALRHQRLACKYPHPQQHQNVSLCAHLGIPNTLCSHPPKPVEEVVAA